MVKDIIKHAMNWIEFGKLKKEINSEAVKAFEMNGFVSLF